MGRNYKKTANELSIFMENLFCSVHLSEVHSNDVFKQQIKLNCFDLFVNRKLCLLVFKITRTSGKTTLEVFANVVQMDFL